MIYMNTKAIKLFAVLAVLAMAFAVVAAVEPMKGNDAAYTTGINVYEICEDTTDVSEITGEAVYYFSEDASVKVTALNSNGTTIYVNNGVSIELKFKGVGENTYTVTVKTVSGDRTYKQAWDDSENYDTTITFVPADKTTFGYTAALITEKTNTSYKEHVSGTLTFATNAQFYYTGTFAPSYAGKNASVASNEEIYMDAAISGNVKFAYGVSYYTLNTSGSISQYVYAASGSKVSKQDVSGNNVVTVISGSVTAYTASGSVTLSGAYNSTGIVLSKGSAEGAIGISITGTDYDAGTITLAGTVEAAIDVVGKDVSIIISKGAEVTTGVVVKNNGKITIRNAEGIKAAEGTNLEGTILNSTGGVVVAENSDLWDVIGSEVYALITAGSTGFVDTRAISKAVAVSGGSIENMTIEVNQTATLTANTEVTSTLVVKGILNIQPGVTLTVAAGATVTASGIYALVDNDGTIAIKASTSEYALIVSENASFLNDGSINSASAKSTTNEINKTFSLKSDKFVNNSTIVVSKNDSADLGEIVNNGTITVVGLIEGSMSNTGTISLNAATLAGNVTISNIAKGAVVDIAYVIVPVNFTLEVNVDGMVDGIYVTADGKSVLTLSYKAEEGATETSTTFIVKGLTATAGTYKSGTTVYSTLEVAGTMNVSLSNSKDETQVDVTFEGRMYVKGDLTIPAKAALTISNDSTTEISGTLTLAKNAEFTIAENEGGAVDATFNVTGFMTANGQSISSIAKGVAYEADDDVTIVTTFNVAVAGAILADVNTVTVYGTVTVSEDIEIPAGMFIDGFNAEATLTISGADIVVDDEAYFLIGAKITSGSLSSMASSAISGTITSDVVFADEDLDTIAYMDLATALTVGGNIELAQNKIVTGGIVIPMDANLIVPNGVTLRIYGCSAEVLGVLTLESGSAFLVEDSHVAEASFTVGGYFMYISGVSESSWWFPAGVLYNIEDEDGIEFDVVTAIDNIAYAVSQDIDGEVYVTGDVNAGTLTITGDGADETLVTFNGDVKATITMKDVKIALTSGKEINATFASASGSVIIKNATTSKFSITEDDGLTVSGTVTDIVAGEIDEVEYAETAYSIAFLGDVAATTFSADMIDGGYADGSAYPAFLVTGTLTAQGRAVSIDYPIVVTGSLEADSAAKITIYGGVEVLGSLIAAEGGQIIIEAMEGADELGEFGDLIVGSLLAELKDKRAVPDEDTGAAVVISGDISVDGTVIALASASIDDEIVEDMYALTIVVDYSDYLKIYNEAGYVDLATFVLPVVQGVVVKALDAEGNEFDEDEIELSSTYNAFLVANIDFTDNDTVYIVVTYDVYDVVIKTDEGIKSIALNGMVMVSDVTNVFTLEDIPAGTYTVTYTLKAGYEGTPVLTTSMGTILQGYTISVSGDYTEDIVYQLSGTEKEVTPEPVTPEEKSEWTITTILLVILVILIAIMAVIVALRLNRN